MIGVTAAVLLFGASVWLFVDGLYVPAASAPNVSSALLRRLRRMLAEADLEEWPPQLVLLASAACAVVTFAAAYQALGWVVPALFVGAAAGIGPVGYVMWRREARRAAKDEALVSALDRAQEELRTGTIQDMLMNLGRLAPSAVQPAFLRLAWDLEHQRDFADSLRASQTRIASSVWDSCVAALLLSHAVGERNLRATFKRMAANARAEVQLRGSIRAQQAQQVTSARITMAVPIAVVLFMRAGYPAADRFYASPAGELILFCCGLCIVFGYWSMMRVGSVARGPRAEVDG